jgi:hypothetical protein
MGRGQVTQPLTPFHGPLKDLRNRTTCPKSFSSVQSPHCLQMHCSKTSFCSDQVFLKDLHRALIAHGQNPKTMASQGLHGWVFPWPSYMPLNITVTWTQRSLILSSLIFPLAHPNTHRTWDYGTRYGGTISLTQIFNNYIKCAVFLPDMRLCTHLECLMWIQIEGIGTENPSLHSWPYLFSPLPTPLSCMWISQPAIELI